MILSTHVTNMQTLKSTKRGITQAYNLPSDHFTHITSVQSLKSIEQVITKAYSFPFDHADTVMPLELGQGHQNWYK